MTGVPWTKSAPDGWRTRPNPSIMHLGCVTNAGPTTGNRGGSAHPVARLAQGCPLCADGGYAAGRGGVTARDARGNGSERRHCRDQRFEEEHTARGNCSDQCHASGLLEWAKGKL